MKNQSLLLLLILSLLIGCQKDTIAPASKEVNSSAWISIFDPDGNPIANANVNAGTMNGVTDDDGHLLLNNIRILEDSYIQVEKSGYFGGSRRFTSREGQLQYVEIILMPLQEAGSFSTSSGGTISIGNKSSVSFPADAIMTESGNPYSGSVHVMGYPINADDPELSRIMPGNLSGINTNGELGFLASYGMLAVELQNDQGAPLQLASGKKAEIRIEVSTDLLSAASSTIPLWYFDEEKGYWIEDGNAIMEGNAYVGEVSHFTIWNCDDWMDRFDWEGTFHYANGQPAAGVEVCLTIVSRGMEGCDRTNSKGILFAKAPKNEAMVWRAKDQCSVTIASGDISPASTLNDPYIGTLPGNLKTAVISGKAITCNNTPVTNGLLQLIEENRSSVNPFSTTDGSFEFTYLVCESGVVSANIIDVTNHAMSFSQAFQYTPYIQMGIIPACQELDEFVKFTVKGFDHDYVYFLPQMSRIDLLDYKSTTIFVRDPINDNNFNFSFNGLSTGIYPDAECGARVDLPNGEFGYVINFNVDVTEYGPIGTKIKGTFEGKVTAGSNGAGGHGYSDLTGSFTSIRTE
ncbi:MAG: carboxypeptidase-like regulatory domain-containing protein [Bacteroidota bacterium]|nr:carboxypeptidase-like regulatory domain-containing protein [Bacteroidota bacterium]